MCNIIRMEDDKIMICYLCTDPTQNIPLPNPLYRCSGTGHPVMVRMCDECLEPCIDCGEDIYTCHCGKDNPPNVFRRISSVEIVEINTGV